MRTSRCPKTSRSWASSNDATHELAKKLEEVGEPSDRSYLWNRLASSWVKRCASDSRLVIIEGTAESAADYSFARARMRPDSTLTTSLHT